MAAISKMVKFDIANPDAAVGDQLAVGPAGPTTRTPFPILVSLHSPSQFDGFWFLLS